MADEHRTSNARVSDTELRLMIGDLESFKASALSITQKWQLSALRELLERRASVEPSATQRLLGAAQSRVQHYEAALRKIIAGRDSLAQSNIAHDALYSDSPSE